MTDRDRIVVPDTSDQPGTPIPVPPAGNPPLAEASMSDQLPMGSSMQARRPWVTPALVVHASLSALTQLQYPQDFGADSVDGGPQRVIPCSQGFCP